MTKTSIRLGAVAALVALAACGGGAKPAATTAAHDSLTERQRDSAYARSQMPGAQAIGKAMRVADSTSAEVNADTAQ